jgi:hypothetical protein
MKKTFYCISCQRERPIEQLGKTIPINRSKRCITCCENAAAQRARLTARSSENEREFSAAADEIKRMELGGF